ncbi:MAG: alpha-amylase family glycosyl hydrolase, partial [Phycisphaerae bacterium]
MAVSGTGQIRSAHRRGRAILAVMLMAPTSGLGVAGCSAGAKTEAPISYANRYDVQRAERLAVRAADWRNGAIVYQVLVDRFAPAADLEAKRPLYAPPKRLRPWSEKPKRGKYLQDVRYWSHELDFWGGDLQSLMGRLGYVEQLGIDVLYLNPIHQAYSNHKYDAEDYFAVSPEYGTRQDVKDLATALHGRGMRLVLDGVFNHMGRNSPWFQDAIKNPDSPWRNWFYIGDEYEHGYRVWNGVPSLPTVRLENPQVRARIFGDRDSVVQGYLRDGVDGWRLDVAPELGFVYLGALTEAAHAARAGSLVIGENWTYPDEWMPALDAVMNFHFWQIILNVTRNSISGPAAGRMIQRVVDDTGLDALLKCWVILDNHDLVRLKTQFKKTWRQRMAQVLQFTLPGSPCVYYGVEVGMRGGRDPEQRGPMRWDLMTDENPDLKWMRRLIALRRDSRALKIGDFAHCESDKVLAFVRRTDRVEETTLVVVNPTGKKVKDWVQLPDAKLMSWTVLGNRLGPGQARVTCGLVEVEIPAQTAWVLMPEIS